MTEQKFGRTWADMAHSGIVLIGLAMLLLAAYLFDGFSFLLNIPLWVFASILSSLLFLPFLIARAKDDAHLVVVVDGPQRLTEYRIGKRYKWDIEGEPLTFTSSTGTRRLIVSEFDTDSGKAKGSALSGMTQFDIARDIGVFTRLSSAFSEHLREERLTKETIGVEVERRVSELSSRWLGILYGSLEPSEIESALDIENQTKPAPVEMELEDVLND